jgi:DNA repair exonuclease SbcCD ATPase subunit
MKEKQATSRKVLKIKCDLEMAHLYVKQAKEVTAIYNEPCTSANVIESCLKAKAEAEKDVELYKQRLVEAHRELEEVNAPLGAVKAEASKLNSDLNHLLSKSESKSYLIKYIKENYYHDQVLRPSRVVDEIGEVDDSEHTFHKSPCALCRMGFPHFDVILALCMCQYHPWCAVMQNWTSNVYATEDCKKKFPDQ